MPLRCFSLLTAEPSCSCLPAGFRVSLLSSGVKDPELLAGMALADGGRDGVGRAGRLRLRARFIAGSHLKSCRAGLQLESMPGRQCLNRLHCIHSVQLCPAEFSRSVSAVTP